MFFDDTFLLIVWLVILIPFVFIGCNIYKLCRSIFASKGNEMALRMEKTRLKARLISLFALVAGIVGFVLCYLMEMSFAVSLTAGIIAYGLLQYWATKVKQSYSRDFKKNFVNAELSAIFDSHSYMPDDVLDSKEITTLNIFGTVDRVSGNDLIKATYKGLSFSQSDIHLDDVNIVTYQDEDGHNYDREVVNTVFQGRVMRFDFKNPFRGVVQVVRRDFSSAKIFTHAGNWKKVETELAGFSDIFEVYAHNEVDAMSVMTPQMIEGIHYLDQKINVPMAFEFSGKSMYVFMALSRDSFDVSGKKTVLEERELLQKDMELVTGFLDTMYFKERKAENNNIFSETGTSSGIGVNSKAESPSYSHKQTGSRFEKFPFLGKMKRTGLGLQGSLRFICDLFLWLPCVLWACMSVYALVLLPYGIALDFSITDGMTSFGETVSTWAYVFIGAIFLIPACLVCGLTLQDGLAYFFLGRGRGLGVWQRMKKLVLSCVVALLWSIPLLVYYFFIAMNIE